MTMNNLETFGVAALGAAEMQDTTGGEYSVMWVLGYVWQTLITPPEGPSLYYQAKVG